MGGSTLVTLPSARTTKLTGSAGGTARAWRTAPSGSVTDGRVTSSSRSSASADRGVVPDVDVRAEADEPVRCLARLRADRGRGRESSIAGALDPGLLGKQTR